MSIIRGLMQLFGGSRLQRSFDRNREELQRSYFLMASSSGLPRGLKWKGCDWLPAYVVVREQSTGEISRLSAINLTFEAVEGGEMESVKAVSTVREACAVFQWNGSRWNPTGRTLFNMDPATAVQRFGETYRVLESDKG
jgi:hypothetical protein